MPLPDSLEAYPHFSFCAMMNDTVDVGTQRLGPFPRNVATSLRQKIYTWRKICARTGLRATDVEELKLLNIHRWREWLGVSVSLPPATQANHVYVELSHNIVNSDMYSEINARYGAKAQTASEALEAAHKRSALEAQAHKPTAPADSPLPERQLIRPPFPCHSTLPADLKLYNRDGTDRYTAEQAQADRKRGLGNGMPNDDASPWWYPGYGNLGPSMRPLAARYALPIFSTNDELLEVSQFWATYADIPVIAHE